jgi:hypothetical protein
MDPETHLCCSQSSVCDARRRFSVLSSGIRRLTCSKYGVLCWRHNDWRRDAWRWFPTSCPVAFRGALNMTSFGVATLASDCNVVSDGIPRFICVKYGVLWGRRDQQRWFSNVAFKGIPRLTYSEYGVFWWCRDARRQFSSLVSNGIRRYICGKCGVFVGVAMIGVATLGVGFPTSCPITYQSLSVTNMASSRVVAEIVVATLGVGFPT